jgi:hypothetical protein
MKRPARLKFKQWLESRGVKISFAADKMRISYSHLLNWLAGRDGLSPEAGLKIEAFTGGEIKMIDCILPNWDEVPLFIWGKGKMTLRQLKKSPPQIEL